MPKKLYLHCSVGCKDEDNSMLAALAWDASGETKIDGELLDKLFSQNWDKKLFGAPQPPIAILKCEDGDGNLVAGNCSRKKLAKKPIVLTKYPEGGDLFFVVAKKQTPLYVHMEEEDLSEELDFLQFLGKSVETLIKYFVVKVGLSVSKLKDGSKEKKKATESHQLLKDALGEGRLCISFDGEKTLAKNTDVIAEYPEDGDCHLILAAEQMNAKVEVKKPTASASAAGKGNQQQGSTTAFPNRNKKEIILKFDKGDGPKSMLLPYEFGKTTARGTLMEFAYKIGYRPDQAIQVVCLTADQKSVIPDDFWLDPRDDAVYHVADRPDGPLGQGQVGAAGCCKPGTKKEGITLPGGPINDTSLKTTPSSSSAAAGVGGGDDGAKSAVMAMLNKAQTLTEQGKYAEAAKALAPLDQEIPDENPGKMEVLSRLGLIHQEAGNWKKAISYFQKCVDLDENSIVHLVARGKAQVEAGQHTLAVHSFNAALGIIKNSGMKASEEVIEELNVRLGGAMLLAGQVEQSLRYIQPAAKLDQGNVEPDSDKAKKNRDMALMYMTRLYVATENYENAMTVAISLLVKYGKGGLPKDSKSPAIKAMIKEAEQYKANFAWCVQNTPDAFQYIYDKIIGSERGQSKSGLAQGIGYLGVVLRDQSQLDIALKCYATAMELDPSDNTMMLNYCHIFEQIAEVKQCNVVLYEHFKKFPDAAVGGLTAGRVAELMGNPSTWPEGKDCTDVLPLMRAAAKAVDAGEVKRRKCIRFNNDEAFLFDTAAEADAKFPEKQWQDHSNDAGTENKCTYTEQQQALLSLFFTVVKVFYTLGHLDPIPDLVAVIDPLRKGQTLHRTAVRNEQAYFTTVSTMMQYHDPYPTLAEVPSAEDPLLYYVGDSHSLSPSWGSCVIDGQEHFVVNCLVTGLKMWHLRPKGQFYPKENFERRTHQIPEGATVCFNFGEIDCREGILRSVEKGLYADIKEGLEVAIDHYLIKLAELQQKKNFKKIYIHLPLPVLDPTRSIVLGCGEVFRERLSSHDCPLKKVKANYSMIDVGGFVLEEAKGQKTHPANTTGLKMKAQFCLDGTHISPNYLKVLKEKEAVIQM